MKVFNNGSQLNYFFCEPIHFIITEELEDLQEDMEPRTIEFDMKIPTFRDVHFNQQFQIFLSFLTTDITELRNKFFMFDGVETHFVILKRMLTMPELFKEYIANFVYIFNHLGIELVVNEVSYTIFGIECTFNIFTDIVNCILESCAMSKKQEIINPYQEKINQIKQQAKLTDNTAEDWNNFFDIVVGLMYEFKISKEDILNSSVFFFSTMGTYYNAIINHQVSLIGFGNGLSKKIYNITRRQKA